MLSQRVCRSIRRHLNLVFIPLSALPVGAAAQHAASDFKPPTSQPASVADAGQAADPMANFARMLPGEWRMTMASGHSMYHTWHWGPGRRSMRVMIDGQGANGTPWRGVDVYFWHPGRKQVRLLGLSPYADGVNDGIFRFDGESAESVSDLYQTGRRRSMSLRWKFDGPDKYRASLLESTGPDGFQPLTEWDFVRIERRTAPHPTTAPASPAADHGPSRPSERWKAIEPLFGKTWETNGKAAGQWAEAGEARDLQTSFEWIPYSDDVYVRVLQARPDSEPGHLLDAYLYYHSGANALRCLALSSRGGVFEGPLEELIGGGMELDLKGYEEDRVVSYVVRFDFEKDATLRQRIWSVAGDERTLLLDVQHLKRTSNSG